MKKVLFITANDEIVWGGSEYLWFESARICLSRDFEVGISVKKRDPLPAKITELGSRKNLTYFLKENLRHGITEKIYKKFVSSSNVPAYRAKILKWKPDVAIVSQGNNRDGLELMEFFFKHKIKYISISQAVYEGIWPTPKVAGRMRTAYTNALANYFVSKSNLEVTELQVGTSIPRAKVVRNPYNVEYNNQLPYPHKELHTLACVARFEFYAKGQDVLLQVLSDKKWKERDLTVNFYGSGINEEGIARLIKHFNLNNASIKGYVSTMEIWKQNQGLVLPSRFEGLPLALVEAMLCGRFAIVTNVSGNKEAIIDNVNGFLAEAPQPEYLDNAMERAWQRRSEWQGIGSKARQYIKTLVSDNPANDFVNEITRFIS